MNIICQIISSLSHYYICSNQYLYMFSLRCNWTILAVGDHGGMYVKAKDTQWHSATHSGGMVYHPAQY